MGILQTNDFISRLKQSYNHYQFCMDEKIYLDDNYQGLPTRKRAYSEYRKVIKESDLSDGLKNECVEVFSLSKEEYDVYKSDYADNIIKDQDNLKPIKNYKGYINKAVSLLDSNNYSVQIIGFAALTGRRVSEIGCSAEFKIDSSNTLIFKGQLKNRKLEDSSYKIPCLIDSLKLVQKFDLFRRNYTKYLGSTEKFHNNNSRYISQSAKKHFSEFVENIKPKDLRSIYAEIACYLHKPINQTKQRYFSLILGHSKKDLITFNSYFDFRLED